MDKTTTFLFINTFLFLHLKKMIFIFKKEKNRHMNTIYTSDELDILLNALSRYERINFIKRYINDLVHKNKEESIYKLFSDGVIKKDNKIVEYEIVSPNTFFNFPLNDKDNLTYTTSSLENCIKMREIMDNVLLYI
jgi:hypothetical protein